MPRADTAPRYHEGQKVRLIDADEMTGVQARIVETWHSRTFGWCYRLHLPECPTVWYQEAKLRDLEATDG